MPVEPTLFVVFGGTGDLMKRKLLPSLFHLSREQKLHDRFVILGIARDATLSDDAYREWGQRALLQAGINNDDAVASWCNRCLHYHAVTGGHAQDFASLRREIEQREKRSDLPENRVFYLALPPQAFQPTIEGLGRAGLNDSAGWTRIVIEKPFGRDLASAVELNQLVHRHFDESQVFRIDHYLGKETVQNLLVFRFANPIFESVWNRNHVKSVQITVGEDLGVEKRARYYDASGALRDMVQNHLTQLMTLVAMEAPAAFEADAIRDEKVKVLRSIATITADDAVRAQYVGGASNGRTVHGYRDEDGVPRDSTTESYIALQLSVSNWRWQGVPFLLRTGKRLERRITQIRVNFREPPVMLFQRYSACEIHENALVLTVQPDEGFDLCFDVKTPGQDIKLKTQQLHFRYSEAFGRLPEGYETLLFDVLTNDQTLFVRSDEVEASWKLYDPVLASSGIMYTYPAGSWGPPEADALAERHGDRWQIM